MPDGTPAAPTPVAAPADATKAPANTPTPEAAASPEAKPTEQLKLGPAYAKLAKEQKAAREAREALKAERAKVEAEHKAWADKLAQYEAYEQAKANAKRQPLKFLEQLGLTYQDLTEAQMAGGDPTPSLEVKAVRDELETFRKQMSEKEEERAKEAQAQLEAEQKRLVEEYRGQVHQQVKAAGEKYELTNLYGQQDQVFRVIDAHAQEQLKQGIPPEQIKLLSVEEAAEAVEKDLEAQAEKLRQSKKFSAAGAKPEAGAETPAKPVAQPNRATVNNSLSSSTSASASASKKLSQDERRRRALAILEAGPAKLF